MFEFFAQIVLHFFKSDDFKNHRKLLGCLLELFYILLQVNTDSSTRWTVLSLYFIIMHKFINGNLILYSHCSNYVHTEMIMPFVSIVILLQFNCIFSDLLI